MRQGCCLDWSPYEVHMLHPWFSCLEESGNSQICPWCGYSYCPLHHWCSVSKGSNQLSVGHKTIEMNTGKNTIFSAMSTSDVISPILNLPEEILVEIFSHLPTSSLLRGVAQTCRTWYWIVRRESESGRILKSLDIDRNWLGPDAPDVVETFSEILSCYGSAQSFRFRNFDRKTLTSVVDDVLKVSARRSKPFEDSRLL